MKRTEFRFMQAGGSNATRRAAVLILLGGVWITSCSEHSPSGPSTQSNLESIVVISDPLGGPLTTPHRSFPDGGSFDGSIAYISIPQGGVPDGVSVSIRNLRTNETLTASLVEGGLDPIPIAAEAGDSIEIVVTVRDGTPLQAVIVVPAHRPPVVVRTSPPPRKTGVPLNVTVQVVFSEPVDSSSVTTEAITLTRVRDGAPVTGSAMRSPGTPLQAEWQPSGSLEPGTEYRLEVRRVRDLSGDSLQTPVFVSFTTGSALAPVPLQNVMKVAAGYDHSCALDSAGRAYCWGEGLWGQLGRGTRDLDAFAEPVVAESSFGEVVVGESFSCGLTAGGVAMCWGLNWFGQLGLSQRAAAVCSHPDGGSALACSLAPVVVQSNVQFRSLTAGAAHVCGLTFEGRAYCWGDNVSGQLGADDTGERCDQYYTRQLSCSSTPVLVQGGFSFDALEAGGYHTCGLTSDGSAYCWGQNLDGELGTGDTIGGAVPRPVAAGGRRFFTISAGRWHTCGVADDGRTYCWGWNGDGQLGVGDFDPRSLPTPIFSVTDRFASVRGGAFWTTALRADGALYVWGRQSVVAFTHLPGATFSFVVPGRDHLCLGGSGEAYCFGSNFHGQLGNGQVLGSFTWTPQRVLTRP